jgi:ubiquinone biosynthesis protein
MPPFLPVPWFARGRLRRRGQQIATVLARHGLGSLMTQIGLSDMALLNGWTRPLQNVGLYVKDRYSNAERFRLALTELDATFIKLGQALSTRPDLLPADWIVELSKLQDAAPAAPFPQIRDVICEELGSPPEEIFATFDSEPMASASIGQVHRATLKNGHRVIVKVVRPGIPELCEQDLDILGGMAEFAEGHSQLGRDYDVAGLADEFAYRLRNELDYTVEGSNADLFRRNFAGDKGIYIPRVYWRWTTQRVLTMEWLDGIKVSDLAALDAAGIDRHAVAENAVRLMLREVFEFGFFHADPHPGNVLVLADGSTGLLDFGMVGRLTPKLQDILLRMILAIAANDAEGFTDELYSMGAVRMRTKRPALQRDLAHFLDRYVTGSIKELATADAGREILSIAFKHRLQLPSELIMLIRVLTMSEGLGVMLDPDFRLFEFAEPYLKKFWTERRSPTALASKIGKSALDATELALDLPHRVALLLEKIERGELDVTIHVEEISTAVRQLQKMANRLAISILLGATIISFGMILGVFRPSFSDQYLGPMFLLGFMFSLGLGAWLMWSIWWSGRT